MVFVGDVRLYNRHALRRELDLGEASDEAADIDIAWRAYLRWGEDAPQHLVGDFAFAVWDERRRSIFAARDHLGVRPLYYKIDDEGAYIASDVRQLLAVTPQAEVKVDPEAILERFSRRWRTPGLTYFRNISVLPAGHTLTITPRTCNRRRYWVPSFEVRDIGDEDSYVEIRTLFRQAVHDRLESQHPIVAHSSGGADSSAILMVADQIYAAEPHRPSLVMASATTVGMPCDDSRYMDAVARRVRFESVRWDALQPNLADLEDPVLAHPGLRRGTGGGPRRDLELARERHARVLLHGFFGDGLTYAFGISRDMFRAGQWGTLAEDVLAAKGLRARLGLVARSVAGLLPPGPALRALSRIENRSFHPAPEWMGPELRARYPPPAPELALPDVHWPSHFVCELWARMTGAQVGISVDSIVAYGAEDGIEIRLPYLDVRLLERILTIPWRARVPVGGDYRRLGRRALGPLLPPEFTQRADQGSWTPVWTLGARRMLPTLERLLSDGTWLSAPYVKSSQARTMLKEVTERSESVERGELLLVSGFAVLEAWLRRVFRYTARQEGHPCQTSPKHPGS
jgi:asparagine synthase (glutamine-hydrolysing)